METRETRAPRSSFQGNAREAKDQNDLRMETLRKSSCVWAVLKGNLWVKEACRAVSLSIRPTRLRVFWEGRALCLGKVAAPVLRRTIPQDEHMH